MSVSRSAECIAAPAVIDAVIRFVWMLPAARPPYMNCVILPSAPIGVIEVSPVARHATIESSTERIAARKPIQSGMSKNTLASTTTNATHAIVPRRNHFAGTSTSAMVLGRSSCAVVEAPSTFAPSAVPRASLPRPERAATAVRHLRPNASRPFTTMIVTPGHTIQVRTVPKPGALPARPCVCSHVPSTPQPMSAPSTRPRQMRTPIIAPAPIIRMSVWKPSVRPSHFWFHLKPPPSCSGTIGCSSFGPFARPVMPERSFIRPPAIAP
jgi:hypothetical protein